jgi:hypothetical protein
MLKDIEFYNNNENNMMNGLAAPVIVMMIGFLSELKNYNMMFELCSIPLT